MDATKDLSIISQFFPKELTLHFDITKVEHLGNIETKEEFYIIEFTEKNILSERYNKEDYESKGFVGKKLIQDFPIRGKSVFLRVIRRGWRHKQTKEIVKNDFTYIAEGSKFTKELSDFLKGRSRFTPRYNK